MNVGMMPKRWPISRAPVLNSVARSAASTGSEYRMAASNTPGPVSVCRPSIGTRKAAISSISALTNGRLCARRMIEYPNMPGVSVAGRV